MQPIDSAIFHDRPTSARASALQRLNGLFFRELASGGTCATDFCTEHEFSVLALGVFIIMAALAFRVLFIGNAAIFQDEFVYKALSSRLIDYSALIKDGLVPSLSNGIYLLFVGVHSWFPKNGYVLVGLLNVVIYAASAIPLWFISKRLGLNAPKRVLAVLLALALPYSAYTKYFMPESWYVAPFLFSQWFLLEGLLRRRLIWFGAAGSQLALLFFIKSHAIALLAAAVVSTFLCCWTERTLSSAPKYIVSVLCGFILSFLAIRLILTSAPGPEGTFGLYGHFVGVGLMDLVHSALNSPTQLLFDLAFSAAGHALFVGLLYSLPIGIAAGAITSLTSETSGQERAFLAIIALTTLLMLIGMSILFLVSVRRPAVIGMRYYGFTFSLLIPLMIACTPSAKVSRVIAFFSLISVALGFRYISLYSPIMGLATVSDAPDIAIMHLPTAAFYILAACGAVAAVLLAFGRRSWRIAAVTYIFAFSVADAVILTNLTRQVFNGPYVSGEEAAIANTVIPPSERSEVLLISPNLSNITKFLFDYQGAPTILFGGTLFGKKSKALKWTISLEGSLTSPADLERVIELPTIAIYRQK